MDTNPSLPPGQRPALLRGSMKRASESNWSFDEPRSPTIDAGTNDGTGYGDVVIELVDVEKRFGECRSPWDHIDIAIERGSELFLAARGLGMWRDETSPATPAGFE